MPKLLKLETSKPMSTGLKKELLLQLKTKDNVDHAGPSPLLDHWKELKKSNPENYNPTLNHNWLTVHLFMETTDAKED
jgi:hypothetical protein